jgi:hypothetical protein
MKNNIMTRTEMPNRRAKQANKQQCLIYMLLGEVVACVEETL